MAGSDEVASRAVAQHRNPDGWICGERHWRAKHSDAEVNLVRDYNDRGWGWRRIARKLGLPANWVKDIVRFRRRPFVAIPPTFMESLSD